MAVGAFDRVDIVRTLEVFECGIHLFHIQAAIRELRMAGGTGSPGLLPVLFVACQATQSLVNAHRSAIVGRLHLRAGRWSMALVAQSLPPIRADLHQPRALM